eukprot:7278432-Alexandrium_andersonii.AAC.1
MHYLSWCSGQNGYGLGLKPTPRSPWLQLGFSRYGFGKRYCACVYARQGCASAYLAPCAPAHACYTTNDNGRSAPPMRAPEPAQRMNVYRPLRMLHCTMNAAGRSVNALLLSQSPPS